MVEANKTVESDSDQEMQAEQIEPYTQSILLIIKAAQNQNGLRHSDYGRYHRYCCRRMIRLRRSLGFTQVSRKRDKKQAFHERPVTTDLAKTNQKYLQILLFKAEADWAYAMQMK